MRWYIYEMYCRFFAAAKNKYKVIFEYYTEYLKIKNYFI